MAVWLAGEPRCIGNNETLSYVGKSENGYIFFSHITMSIFFVSFPTDEPFLTTATTAEVLAYRNVERS